MKFCKLTLALIVLLSLKSFAQNAQTNQFGNSNFVSKNYFHNNTKNLNGEFFLNENFKTANLLLKNPDGQSKQLYMRYFVYGQQMHILTEKGDTAILKPSLIKSVNINCQKFIYTTYQLNSGVKNSYFEELSHGKLKLLKRYQCKFLQNNIKTTSSYKEADPDTYKIYSKYYVQSKDFPALLIHVRKSKVLKLLEDKKADIIKYIKKNKLKIKKEQDLKKIFNYYNSISEKS